MSSCTICGGELLPENTTGICAEDRLLARNGDIDGELWLPIVGFRGWEISNLGRIRDARTHVIREPDHSGRYPRVSLNGRRRNVHTLMGASWLGPKPWSARLIRHLDDNPNHLAAENLMWGNHADNAQDRIANQRKDAAP